jgi:hypothetical protein
VDVTDESDERVVEELIEDEFDVYLREDEVFHEISDRIKVAQPNTIAL